MFQRDSYDHCVNDDNIVSCECNLELFVKYWDGALINRTEVKYETLDEIKQDGITYQKIVFDKMLNMNNNVITSLHELIKKLFKDSISKVPNKNKLSLTQKTNAMCEGLDESKALWRKTPLHVIRGLTQCISPEFVVPFYLMINTERVRHI